MKRFYLFVVLSFFLSSSTVYAQVVYVTPSGSGSKDGSSWANALDGNSPAGNGYTKLAQATQTATLGKQFWIAEGTYKAATDNDRNRSFILKDGMSCYGGFIGTETTITQRGKGLTIFSGDIGIKDVSTDNSYHVFNINSQGIIFTNTSILDQITISLGYADGTSLASQGGGIIIGKGTKLRISNSTIQGNTSKGNGGGVFISSTSKIVIDNCLIIDNSQIVTYSSPNMGNSASGCGIFSQGNLNLLNSQIRNNSNSTEGSGVYNTDSLTITNCKIESNPTISFYAKAGGISNSGYCSLKNSSITNHNVKMRAGGIWNKEKSTMLIDNSDVSYNIVDNKDNAVGGGILNEGILTVTNSRITHNSSMLEGGGINNALKGECYLTKCSIAYNIAAGGNSAPGGGGVCNQGKLELYGCTISNNSTAWYGGGIYNPTIVRNCIVVNNERSSIYSSGGGIWIGIGCKGVFNSTIMNNSGEGISSSLINGYGSIVILPDTLLLKNSIVYGNNVQLSGRFNVSNSCIEGIYPDHNNIFSNPVCENPTKGKGVQFDGVIANWRLQAYSPCINRGDNNSVYPNEILDADGNPRIKFNIVDMGAFEYQTTPKEEVDYSNNIVYISDVSLLSGNGSSWTKALAGNATSYRYPGYSMLYQAIKDAPQKCQVWVKKGTFKVAVDADRKKSLLIESKTKIYGGFAGTETTIKQRIPNMNETILSGNIGSLTDSLDNSYHVFYSIPSTTIWKDTAMIDNVTISEGLANGVGDDAGGGGMSLSLNSLTKLNSCKIISNSANGSGNENAPKIYIGGAGIRNKGILLMDNCQVLNNKAVLLSGGIFNENILSLKNCVINNNRISFIGNSYVETWGGAGIYNYLNAKLTVNSSEIKNNKTPNNLHGGGIYNKGKFQIKNSNIESNFSGRDGGGIYSTGPTYITDCHVTKNQSAYTGGGVFATDTLKIDNCLFDYNAGHSSPSIYTSGNGTIYNSEICHSVSTGQFGSAGGINSSGKTRVINCNIHSHDTHGIKIGMTGSIFSLVIIGTGSDGGGILHQGDTLWVENCNIHHNLAGGGGGIAIYAGVAIIKNSKIVNNYTACGGAVRNKAKAIISNCLFANNTYFDGGLFQNVNNSYTEILNSTISNNQRLSDQNGNALLVHGEFQNPTANIFKLTNCIVDTQSPLRGNYPGVTGSEDITYSNITGGFSGIGNINSNSLFANPTAGIDTSYNALYADWSLKAGSPCINKGNLTGISNLIPTKDLAGNPRIKGIIDMGAYEYTGFPTIANEIQNVEKSNFNIYPNPTTNELIIDFEGKITKTNVEIFNSIGQVVYNGSFGEKTVVQTGNFTPGAYLVKLKSGEVIEFKKIVKK